MNHFAQFVEIFEHEIDAQNTRDSLADASTAAQSPRPLFANS